MNLSESLDQHERESGASAGARRVAALRLLRDYQVEYAEITEIAALTPSDLEDLFTRWYLTHEQADPEGALELIDAAEEWLGWLDRRDGGDRARSFIALAARLREDLPRVIAAERLLRAHIHRHDETGITAESSAGGPLLHLTGGLSHVIRPQEVDYARAEQDHFRVAGIEGERASLQSPAGARRKSLPPLAPVLLPPGVASLLRTGDTLCVEVAPTAQGWEVLEVSGVFPGGYDAAAP